MNEESTPTILADSAQAPSPILPRLTELGAHVRIGELEAGNYVISGSVAVAYMTAHEFVTSISDGRLFHIAGKMSHAFTKSVFLVEGDVFSTRIPIAREAIDGAMASIALLDGASVMYVRNPTAAADLIYRMARQVQKNLTTSMVFQRAKLSPGREQSIFTLESVSGIGPSTAPKALERFRSVFNFVNASVDQLTEISGIGQKKAERIHASLHWSLDSPLPDSTQ